MTLRFQTTKILNGSVDPSPELGEFGDLYVKTTVRPDGKRVPTAFFGPKDSDGRLGWGEPVLVGEDAFGIQRTADPAALLPADATANTGIVMTLVGRLMGRFPALTGKTSWWEAPDITLAGTRAHVDQSTAAHGGILASSEKGAANGLATLDGSTKVPTSQLPDAVLGGVNYRGTWNASTNTPILASATGTKGHYYRVSVNGSTNLDGITDWKVGDWAIYNGTAWEKVDNTDQVTSVENRTGAVTLTDILQARSERGTANGYASLGTDGKVPAAQLPAASAGTDPAKLTTSDLFSDFVVSGFLPSVPSPASLSVGIPAGSAVAGGLRIEKAAEAARTYAASSDTYADLGSNGVYSYSAVASGAAAPALAASSLRLFRVTTNATQITAVADLRTLAPTSLKHRIPAFLAVKTAAQTGFVSGTLYLQTFESVSKDDQGWFSQNSRWTVGRRGQYRVGAAIQTSALVAGATFDLTIRQYNSANTLLRSVVVVRESFNTAVEFVGGSSVDLWADPGDYFQVWAVSYGTGWSSAVSDVPRFYGSLVSE